LGNAHFVWPALAGIVPLGEAAQPNPMLEQLTPATKQKKSDQPQSVNELDAYGQRSESE